MLCPPLRAITFVSFACKVELLSFCVNCASVNPPEYIGLPAVLIPNTVEGDSLWLFEPIGPSSGSAITP